MGAGSTLPSGRAGMGICRAVEGRGGAFGIPSPLPLPGMPGIARRRGRHAGGMVGWAVEAGCLSEGWGSAKETLRRLDTGGRGRAAGQTAGCPTRHKGTIALLDQPHSRKLPLRGPGRVGPGCGKEMECEGVWHLCFSGRNVISGQKSEHP